MTDDLYAVRTDDPQVQRAVKYLVSLGAPMPTLADTVVNNIGGQWTNSTATFGSGDKSHTDIVGLIAAFPNVTANGLAAAGLIHLSSPLFNVPVPSVNLTAIAPPMPSAPPPPTSAIGAKIYPGSPDAVGDRYYAAPAFVLPNGTTITEGGKTFVLRLVANPFGNAEWWERTA